MHGGGLDGPAGLPGPPLAVEGGSKAAAGADDAGSGIVGPDGNKATVKGSNKGGGPLTCLMRNAAGKDRFRVTD